MAFIIVVNRNILMINRALLGLYLLIVIIALSKTERWSFFGLLNFASAYCCVKKVNSVFWISTSLINLPNFIPISGTCENPGTIKISLLPESNSSNCCCNPLISDFINLIDGWVEECVSSKILNLTYWMDKLEIIPVTTWTAAVVCSSKFIVLFFS
jgi:hypothetical protein